MAQEEFFRELVRKDDESEVHIFRVPSYMRNIAAQDFEPNELFLGLYLHKDLVLGDSSHLDASKVAVAREFCRGPQLPASEKAVRRETWMEFVASFEAEDLARAKLSYDQLQSDAPSLESENITLILDTLFVVAYLQYEYDFHDCWGYNFKPVFTKPRFVAQKFSLNRDLLMLENQIPLCLLEQALGFIRRPGMADVPQLLFNMLKDFVVKTYPFNYGVGTHNAPALEGLIDRLLRDASLERRHHLLDIVYSVIKGSPESTPAIETSQLCCKLPLYNDRSDDIPGEALSSSRNRFRVPSASSLAKVGILVKVSGDSLTLQDVKFERHNQKHVIFVPRLVMNDTTSAIFRNMALYEQILDDGFRCPGEVRTYLYLMSSLLDSVEDVRLLTNQGVIINQLGSTELVCKQWNGMCDGLFIPSITPAYWTRLQDEITELQRSRRNRWFAEIEEKHFSSFVVTVSFLAAAVLLAASIVQTVYSVLAYYKA